MRVHGGALEPFRQPMQAGIVAALRLNFGNRGEDIVEVCPGYAMSLAHQIHLAIEIEPSGILRMTTIDQKHEGTHLAVRQRDPPHGFEINTGHLFTGAQIGEGCLASGGCDPVGNAAAGAAAIEAKHEAWPFWRAAMDEGVDAQGPMQPGDPRRHALQMVETRPPHQ